MRQCKECGSKLVVKGHKCQNCGATVRTRIARIISLGVLGGLCVTLILMLAQDYAETIQSLLGYNRPSAVRVSPSSDIPEPVRAMLTSVPEEKSTKNEPETPPAKTPALNPASMEAAPPVRNRELDNAALQAVGYATPAQSLERTAENIVIEVMGRTALDFTTPTVIRVKKEAEGPGEALLKLTLAYRAQQTISPKMTRSGIMLTALEIFRKLFNEQMLTQVSQGVLRPTLTLVDAAGIPREAAVANLVLRREVAERIDWAKMTPENLEKLLKDEEGFYLHPSLK